MIYDYLRGWLRIAIAASLMVALASQAGAFSLGCQSGDGEGSVSTSTTFALDSSTSMVQETALARGGIVQERLLHGQASNSIVEVVSGEDYRLENEIRSIGALSAYTSMQAGSSEASLDQVVAGAGALGLSIAATKDSAKASQSAYVIDGAILSSQSLKASDYIDLRQSTSLAGSAGEIAATASSTSNEMRARGSFIGQSVMSAELSSIGGDRAILGGEVSVDGAPWLDQSTFDRIYDQDMGILLQGLTGDDGETQFSMDASNSEISSTLLAQGGLASSYVLTGWRWNTENPQLKMYLRDDALLAAEGLTAEEAAMAIYLAVNTWDNVVSQDMFDDEETVAIDPTKEADKYDGFNVHSWISFSYPYSSALGYCRTYYSTSLIVNGYKTALESDICYNTRKNWSTSWPTPSGKYDIQSIALHELGHTLGLADLYLLPDDDPAKNDFEQIMNSYDGPQRYLGNGDIAGVQLLYGAVPLQEDPVWTCLGGTITSDPHMIKDGDGTIHIFARGSDMALYDNANGVWYNMEGYLTSDPWPVLDDDGHIHVFVRGLDGSLCDKVVLAVGSQLEWAVLGGYLTEEPSPAFDSLDGVMRIAVRSTGDSLWLGDLDPISMALQWSFAGGVFASAPHLLIDQFSQAHTFVRGYDMAMYENVATWEDGEISFGWRSLGGQLTGEPAPLLSQDGYIHVYSRSTDGSLQVSTIDLETGAASWQNLGGQIPAPDGIAEGVPAPIEDEGGVLHAIVPGLNWALFDNQGVWDPASTSYEGEWEGIGGYITSDIGTLMDEGDLIVAVRGSTGALHTITLE